MFYLTCNMLPSVDLARYAVGLSRVKDLDTTNYLSSIMAILSFMRILSLQSFYGLMQLQP